jgi:ABC-type nitrate/sulfonate/bicarbonate transport system permease component
MLEPSRLATFRGARLQGAILPITLLVIWQWGGAGGWLPTYLSSPTAIWQALADLLKDGELADAIGASLFRAYTGFLLGAVSGVLIGVAAGRSAALAHFCEPLVSLLNPIPKIAFLPVFLLLFGLGHALMIATITLSVFFPAFLASRHSVASINPLLPWSARNMGASPRVIFFKVILPAAAPRVFVGLRVGLSMAFVILFAAELISGQSGLGYLIAQGQNAGRFDLTLACILVFAVLGFVSDRILLAIQKVTLRGQTLGTVEALTP